MTSIVLGLDVGGSKTRAMVCDGDRVLDDILAGSANPSSAGAEAAGRELDSIFAQLHGAAVVAVCAGVAGVDDAEAEQRFRRLLTDRAPGAVVSVVHDAALILAAADAATGIALIAGTGSVAWGRNGDGRVARAGGWGYLLGDEGSGYWVTRSAVQHALTRLDSGSPPDPLSLQLTASCGLHSVDQLLDHFYTQPERRYWASRAGIVFDLAAGHDPASGAITAAAAAALAALVTRVGDTLGLDGPVVLAGGLLVHQVALQQALRDRLSAGFVRDVRALTREPVHGAIRLARALLDAPAHPGHGGAVENVEVG